MEEWNNECVSMPSKRQENKKGFRGVFVESPLKKYLSLKLLDDNLSMVEPRT